MRARFAIGVVGAMVALAGGLVGCAPPVTSTVAAAADANANAVTSERDLQGIWTDPYQTPLQRPPQYANKETFTDQEREEIDRQRASLPRRDQRVERGTERDVAGAYNAVFQSVRPTGPRTSLIVDPSDGRMPPMTADATARAKAERDFRLALLQPTATCKNKEAACAGGQYGPVSPRRNERPPFYNLGRTNRNDGPEDRSMAERCMGAVLPDFGGYRRIVQSADAVAIFYDTGQGQGWQRVIPIGDRPHLPSHVRVHYGDSRGRWEGNTLVVDVTNFSPKSGFLNARDGLRLTERWTRRDANTILYELTIQDDSTWTRPWTVRQELVKQDERPNRIYYEPRCHEGNYGLTALLRGTRAEEEAFARGKGADPATKDTATDFGNEGGTDVLTGGQ